MLALVSPLPGQIFPSKQLLLYDLHTAASLPTKCFLPFLVSVGHRHNIISYTLVSAR